jgi:MYXO-CTERM domain-containing protein
MTKRRGERTGANVGVKVRGQGTGRLRRVRYLAPIAGAIGIVAACSTPGGSGTASSGAPVATQSPLTTIASGLRSQVLPRYDVGRLEGATPLARLSLTFRLSAAQKADREALMDAQQDPRSPSFRRWLTPDQYAARFGVTPEGLAQVTAWLQSQGFTVGRTSRAGTRLFFSGSVAQVETAFHSEIHRYDVGDALHFALATPAQVPSDVGALVLALHGADDFGVRAPRHTIGTAPSYTGSDAGPPASTTHALAPEDFAKIYDVPNLFSSAATPLNGDGITISIVGQSEFNAGDISSFRNYFGLPATTITETLVPGSGSAVFKKDDLIEASLDLEWSGAVAPHATLAYVYTGDNATTNAFDAMKYVLDEAPTPVLSASFNACEAGLETGTGAQEADEYLEIGNQANLEGVTFVAASGDTGAAGCEANDGEAAAKSGLAVGLPSAIPGITGVGGTSVTNAATSWSDTNDSNQGSVIAPAPVDSAWNDTFENASAPAIAASGGGQSALFLKPVWQVGTAVPTANHRYVPDVALSAGGGGVPFLIELSYTGADGATDASAVQSGVYTVGGTSASTPSFAGMVAVLNQGLVSKHVLSTPGLGNINPELYALVGDTGLTEPITRDVTSGNNCVPCVAGSTGCPTTAGVCPVGEYGYAAGVGYDEVSGLGTIDALNLVNAWEALLPTKTTLVIAPTTTETGATVTLTATVTSTATTPAMTGTVSFYDQYGDRVGVAATVTGNPGTASTTSTTLPPGVDVIFAWYSGDDHYVGSFTEGTTIGLLTDGGPILGGGPPVLVVDAGLDASSFDASAPPVVALDGASGIIITVGDGGTATEDAGSADDSGGARTDSGTEDSGTAGGDGGDAGSDSGSAGSDGGASEDSGPASDDSGTFSDDAGTFNEDSGVTTGDDSGLTLGEDGGVTLFDDGGFAVGDDSGVSTTADDAGTGNGASGGSSSSGCSCVVAGSGRSENESRGGAIGGVLLGMVAFVRRRRARG